MAIVHIIILLAAGILTGFFSGLLGVGGGAIMTPAQDIVYTAMGIPGDMTIKLAFGTSLLVILPTAISGAWKHHQKGVVQWKVATVMGSCTFIAAFAGATLATQLPGAGLKIAFGVLLLATGIRMLTAKLPEIEQEAKGNPRLWLAWAIPIGFATGIMGFGAGIIAVPILVLALRLRMHSAVATSLAIMIFSSVGGVIGYIINGLGIPDLPTYSIGYIHLPSWFLLAVTSIAMAQVGAITAHRLPAPKIKYIFIALMFVMGLRMLAAGLKMLGVLELPGWLI
jgi:uncharacterized membrane protein YfcA